MRRTGGRKRQLNERRSRWERTLLSVNVSVAGVDAAIFGDYEAPVVESPAGAKNKFLGVGTSRDIIRGTFRRLSVFSSKDTGRGRRRRVARRRQTRRDAPSDGRYITSHARENLIQQ